IEKVLTEGQYVLAALPQRKQLHLEDFEPIVQVLAEGPIVHRLFEHLVGGGDDPEIHSNSFHSPKAIHHLVLEDAEDLGLSGKAHVPDLVEKEGSTVRQLELPWLSLGVAAADSRLGSIAKQLALEKGLGDRGAIDGHERIRAARGPVM